MLFSSLYNLSRYSIEWRIPEVIHGEILCLYFLYRTVFGARNLDVACKKCPFKFIVIFVGIIEELIIPTGVHKSVGNFTTKKEKMNSHSYYWSSHILVYVSHASVYPECWNKGNDQTCCFWWYMTRYVAWDWFSIGSGNGLSPAGSIHRTVSDTVLWHSPPYLRYHLADQGPALLTLNRLLPKSF